MFDHVTRELPQRGLEPHPLQVTEVGVQAPQVGSLVSQHPRDAPPRVAPARPPPLAWRRGDVCDILHEPLRQVDTEMVGTSTVDAVTLPSSYRADADL
jgi:hypothetical protein